MSNRYAGSCLCGRVRFEIEGEFERFYCCHCTYCRKDTGSAHAANLFSSGATLSWTSGKSAVKEFTLPQSRHGKAFCATCGSALPMRQMNGAWLMVPAGSLDGEPPIEPTAHLFMSSKAGWEEAMKGIPIFAGLPS